MKEQIVYRKNGKKYRKLQRDEIIEEGALQSWDGGELLTVFNPETIGDVPSSFSKDRDFYNLVKGQKKDSTDQGTASLIKALKSNLPLY